MNLVHSLVKRNYFFFSLVNIYKELKQDIDGFEIPDHGYLAGWAQQGKY